MKALLHNLIPALVAALSSSDAQFQCFSDIDRLYRDGVVIKNEEHGAARKLILPSMFQGIVSMSERLMKYDIPSIISSKFDDPSYKI